ncbi:MAG TPA: CpXC domain-containing protein [Methanocorpusculum sp.]|nr:CpXC domain-containing protein [Methanocorpusculum sp.]
MTPKDFEDTAEDAGILNDYSEDDVIVCPKCGAEQMIHVVPSVNVTRDPDMREKVISGDLFMFTCDKCGFCGYAGFPFIYEDKETAGGFLIYMEPDCEDRAVGIEAPDIADQIIYRDTPKRLVTNVNALKEKIFLFEEGLDDRVMELFKTLALTKLESDDEEHKPDELLFTEFDRTEGSENIMLAAFKEGRYLGVLELPYQLYQSCVITGDPIWDVQLKDCCAVDQIWIAERLETLENDERQKAKSDAEKIERGTE